MSAGDHDLTLLDGQAEARVRRVRRVRRVWHEERDLTEGHGEDVVQDESDARRRPGTRSRIGAA